MIIKLIIDFLADWIIIAGFILLIISCFNGLRIIICWVIGNDDQYENYDDDELEKLE